MKSELLQDQKVFLIFLFVRLQQKQTVSQREQGLGLIFLLWIVQGMKNQFLIQEILIWR